VVARELGIPTVVGVAGVTRILRSGDRVRLDGSAGVVERLDGGDEG
jgi:pyruvate,water dikinase